MQSEIISKLNRHISEGLTREADIVYLLVQLSKLLHQQGILNKYPVLSFYRNWVVHYQLDRLSSNPTMKEIFDRLEMAVRARSQGDEEKALSTLTDTISLKKLWKEINTAFDTSEEFDKTLLKNSKFWSNFGGLLLSILVDLPLIVPAEPSYKNIEEFRFVPAEDDTHIACIQIKLRTGLLLEGHVTWGKAENYQVRSDKI